jgi:hypothetical protein
MQNGFARASFRGHCLILVQTGRAFGLFRSRNLPPEKRPYLIIAALLHNFDGFALFLKAARMVAAGSSAGAAMP